MKQASGGQLVAGEADKPLLEGGYYPGARGGCRAEIPAGEGRSHGARRRQGDGWRRDADRARNARPFAGLHELGIFGEGRRRHAHGADLLQRHRGAEPPRRQPDLFRDRYRLQEDVRARQGHEGGRTARATSGNVQDGRRSAPSSPKAGPIRSSIPASSMPTRRRWRRRSRTRSPSRPPPRRKRRDEQRERART